MSATDNSFPQMESSDEEREGTTNHINVFKHQPQKKLVVAKGQIIEQQTPVQASPCHIPFQSTPQPKAQQSRIYIHQLFKPGQQSKTSLSVFKRMRSPDTGTPFQMQTRQDHTDEKKLSIHPSIMTNQLRNTVSQLINNKGAHSRSKSSFGGMSSLQKQHHTQDFHSRNFNVGQHQGSSIFNQGSATCRESSGRQANQSPAGLNHQNMRTQVSDFLNQSQALAFESNAKGFPYMKKQHLSKSSGIRIDEPVDLPDEPDKEKGTSTDPEYLILKPFEKSTLFTVLEETVVAQNDKIKRQKLKIGNLKAQKFQYGQSFKKVLKTNESLYNQILKLKTQIDQLTQDYTTSTLLGQLKESKTIMVESIQNTLECLSFYKDLVQLNQQYEGRQLQVKLDQFLQTEGFKLSFSAFNTEPIELKINDIVNFISEYDNQSQLLQSDTNENIKKEIMQLQGENLSYDVYSFIKEDISIDAKLNQQDSDQSMSVRQDNKQLKKKIRNLERTLDQIKDKDSMNSYTAIKEYENMKQLLGKVQKENAQYKMVVKGLRQDHRSGLNSSGILDKSQASSTIDYAALLTKKIHNTYRSITEETQKAISSIKAAINDQQQVDYKQLVEVHALLSATHSKFKLFIDYFHQELSTQQQHVAPSIIQALSALEQKMHKIDLDKDKRDDNQRAQNAKFEEEKAKITHQLSRLEYENSTLKSMASSDQVQKTFEQISLMLLSSATEQKEVLNQRQRELIRILFGNQVQSIMEGFNTKLTSLEQKNKSLLKEKSTTLEDCLRVIQANISLHSDILGLLRMLNQGNSQEASQYMIQRQNMQIMLSQVENQLRDTIEVQVALTDKTGLVEVDDKLAMLEDTLILDQSIETVGQSQRNMRASSIKSTSKVSKLKERNSQLEAKLEMMNLENINLKKDLKKYLESHSRMVSQRHAENREDLSQRRNIILQKCMSETKDIGLSQIERQVTADGQINHQVQQLALQKLATKPSQRDGLSNTQRVTSEIFNPSSPKIMKTQLKKHNNTTPSLLQNAQEAIKTVVDEACTDQQHEFYNLLHSQANAMEEMISTQQQQKRSQKDCQTAKDVVSDDEMLTNNLMTNDDNLANVEGDKLLLSDEDLLL